MGVALAGPLGSLAAVPYGLGAGIPPSFDLEDQFTTTDAAPLATPRNCEPGPGVLVATDASSIQGITSGTLRINGTPGAVTGVESQSSFSRFCGRALLLSSPSRNTITSAATRFGWSATGIAASGVSLDNGVGWSSTAAVTARDGGASVFGQTLGAGGQDIAVVMRNSGAWILVAAAGGGGVYTLMWVSTTGTGSELVKLATGASATDISFGGAAGPGALRVISLGPPFSTDFEPATFYSASPSSGVTATGNAAGLTEITWTPASSETMDLSVRRTDDNNRWIIRCVQGSSSIALIENNAGSPTTRSSAAQTWTVGTAFRIVHECNATAMRNVVGVTSKNSYNSATFNQTATGIAASGFTTATDLAAWPRTLTLPTL